MSMLQSSYGTRRRTQLYPFSYIQIDNVHIFVYLYDYKNYLILSDCFRKMPCWRAFAPFKTGHKDSLSDEQATKITWVLKLIRELDQVPSKYFKKLVNTNDIWEVRVVIGGNTFRILGFFAGPEFIILTNSFQKKSRKTPTNEIRLAKKRKREHLNRSK